MEARGGCAVQDGPVVYRDGVDPGVAAEQGMYPVSADPVDAVALAVESVDGGHRHDDIADGTQLHDEGAPVWDRRRSRGWRCGH